MKKIFLCFSSFFILLLLTGCDSNKIVCTKNNASSKEILTGIFQDGKLYEISGEMAQMYENSELALESEKSSELMIYIYEMLGFAANIEVEDNILTVYYNGKTKDISEKLKNLDSDFKNIFPYTSETTIDEFKMISKNDGYTCK